MDFDHPPADPAAQFQRWFEEAKTCGLPNPDAMTLATIRNDSPAGSDDAVARPTARMVLLKSFDAAGAVFYTNRLSRKGRELQANPRACLLVHWDPLGRQVRIEGPVTAVSDAESDAYFATRPRMSQIGAWASRQSQPAASRAELDAAVAAIEKRFQGKPVPRPPHWGGYRVSLDEIEFWQAHQFRMHDRVAYTRDANAASGWKVQRLFP